MCRLAYLPPNVRVNRKTMGNFFEQLECSFGGDGNGYAAISPNGDVVIEKGVKRSAHELAKSCMALNRAGWHVYFHTRKTSIGFNHDDQCHPFKIDGPAWKGTLCHNGTWSDGGVLAKYFDVGSDTAAFARLIGEFGLEEIERRKLMPAMGIFLLYGAKPGETPTHHAIRMTSSSDLEYCPKTGIWASEFFKDWIGYKETFTVATGIQSLEKQPSKGPSGYSYNSGTTQTYNYQRHNSSSCSSYAGATDDSERLQSYWESRGDSLPFDPDSDDDQLIGAVADDIKGWESENGSRYWYHNDV